MKKLMFGALAAAAFAMAAPAAAQDLPVKGGNYWEVAEVTVDDGHFGDYADFLAATYRKTQEFARTRGWIKEFHILANVHKRANEPDLYLVTISDHLATPAEDDAREKEMNAYLANNSRQRESESGARAKFRKLGGTMLLQELLFRR